MQDPRILSEARARDERALSPEDVASLINDKGLERYSRTIQKATDRGQVSTTKPGQILLDTSISRFGKYLEEWTEKAQTKVGPRHSCLRYLKQLKPDVISLLVSQIMIDAIVISQGLQQVALQIANALEEEAKFNTARRLIPKEWKKLNKKFHSKGNEAHKRKVIKACLNKIEIDWEPWEITDKYTLGYLLVEFFVAATGLVTLESPYDKIKNKRKTFIRPTEEVIKWLADAHDNFKAKYPFYLPLVTPPEAWVSPNEGGYPANILMRWPLVHQYNKKAKKLSYREMPEVYDAVNRLQQVAWRVNDFVFAVFDGAWKNGEKIADVPGGELNKLPPKPPDINTNKDARKDWKRRAAIVYEENVQLGTQKILYGKIHFVARHYQYQDFWFPYKLDFRGRAYPIPAFLNPQGCPLAKGLLRFAEGKKLESDEARGWFFIHGSNCWGLDKVSFAKRIAWVNDNSKMIQAIAADPLNNKQWEKADSPWQFLAWCEEYAAWKEDPATFKSYLPVSMDGTNNGLQIYSLLLRDPVGAAATNVSPPDSTGQCAADPADIYQEVADDVTKLLKDESSPEKRRMADDWLAFVNNSLPRAATKRPVMVMPYGGTKYSIREYVEEWLEDEIKDRGLKHDRPWTNNFGYTRYLTSLILLSISNRLVGAVQAMEWLRQVANLCTTAKTPIIWKTPTGFQCYQHVPNMNPLIIRTQLGKIHKVRQVWVPNLTLSKRGQANGLAPNFIHSLDASIMTKVVNVSGNVSLSVAHDCFGTHAADCPRVAEVIREVAYEMFGKRNLLEAFRQQIMELLGPQIEIPEIPEIGTLDVKCVLDSPYFFA